MSRKTALYTLIVFTLCLAHLNVFGQFERLRNYNIKEGLPGSDAYGVTQDSKGYIWIVGDMGASRFDGYSFKKYTINQGLPDNTVFGAWEDAKQRLWFRSSSGKLSYFKNDSIYALPCNDTLAKLMKITINTSIYVDKNDVIWLGTNKSFYIKIVPGWKNTDVRKVQVKNGKYIISLENDKVVFGGNSFDNGHITLYDAKQKELSTISNGIPDSNKEDLRFYASKLQNGNYLASIGKMLISFKDGIIERKAETQYQIICWEENEKRKILICTYGNAELYNSEDLTRDRNLPLLDAKVVTGVWTDKEKNVWITTEGHGAYCMEYPNFKYYTTEDGLTASKISCMSLDHGKIVTGHYDGTITLFEKDSVKKIPLLNKKNTLQALKRINSIFNDGENTYVTTGGDCYLLKEGKLREMQGVEIIGARKLVKTKNGKLWGFGYNRIVEYDPIHLKILQYIELEERPDNIYADSTGTLWIGVKNKIFTCDGHKVTEYTGLKNEIKSRVIEFKEGPDKNLWIITKGDGVFIQHGNTFEKLSEKQGLAGDICKSILVDSNKVWIGTNQGLSKITLKNGGYTIENIYASNGLLTNEINGVIKLDGKIWVSHNSGLSVFDPSDIKTNTYSIPVYIVSTIINDSSVLKEFAQALPYNQNNLTINYIGPSYKNAGNVQYKYKMVGRDSSWTFTNNTSVKYHSLPPGNYTFYAYAKNNDGYWSKIPATATFTILPAWWQTTLFTISVILLSIVTVIALFIYQIKRIQKRQTEKSELKNKIAETELKALRAQMNPHFVYNAINSVQYFITDNDPKSSQKYLAKFAKLIRYVVDNSKPAAIPLQTEIDALNLYLELESLRFETRFDYKIDIDKTIDITCTQIPSMLIQPYVENAIWHGLMHKGEKGRIDISMKMKGDVLMCLIEDNGIGRKRSEELKKLKGRKEYKSYGMTITKERLEIINQLNNLALTVNIVDLENENGSGTGTRVELNIPLN
jgi:ligand-binding sensor domain-containing protein